MLAAVCVAPLNQVYTTPADQFLLPAWQKNKIYYSHLLQIYYWHRRTEGPQKDSAEIHVQFPPVYQDLSTHHCWPVKKPLSKANITVKTNSKCISSNLLSPLRAENKNIATAFQTLLTGVRLYLQCRLANADTFLK